MVRERLGTEAHLRLEDLGPVATWIPHRTTSHAPPLLPLDCYLPSFDDWVLRRSGRGHLLRAVNLVSWITLPS